MSFSFISNLLFLIYYYLSFITYLLSLIFIIWYCLINVDLKSYLEVPPHISYTFSTVLIFYSINPLLIESSAL